MAASHDLHRRMLSDDHFLATQAPELATVPGGQVFTVVLDGDIALKDSQQAPRM
jgi:hypothetical protein